MQPQNMKSFAVAMVAALGFLLATVSVLPAARADDTSCTGPLSGVTITGNLVVPDSAACSVFRVSVTGNVLVRHEASFEAVSDVTISGNVLADQCEIVLLGPGLGSVGGNVEIQHCVESSGYSNGRQDQTIGGNFHCHNNFAPCVAEGGSIGGNANVSQNFGGTSRIDNNQIQGNLQCVGNTAAPNRRLELGSRVPIGPLQSTELSGGQSP
jgi:hypothetical protein